MKKINNCRILIISLITSFLSIFIKRKEKYLAFGSWCGELYIDNSKYLFEYAVNNFQDYKFIWIGDETVRKCIPKYNNVVVYKKDSIKSILALLQCKYMFCTQMHRADLCTFNVYKGAKICSLDHGVPVKKWAQDAIDYEGEYEYKNYIQSIYYKIIGEKLEYDFFAVASELHAVANTTALKYRGCTNEKNLKYGTPRNDLLVNYNQELSNKLKIKYSNLIGFDKNKRIIMYLPTYRRKCDKIKSFTNMSLEEKEELERILIKYNAILLEKNHFVTNKKGNNNDLSDSDYIIKLTEKVDLQEMLLFTDIQVSDYSGGYLDFILMDKPVIHFAYDYEEYRDNDSGLYYDIEDFSAGKITKDFKETIKEIEELLSGKDKFTEKRKHVRNKYMTFETGNASKQIINHVLNNKKDKKN